MLTFFLAEVVNNDISRITETDVLSAPELSIIVGHGYILTRLKNKSRVGIKQKQCVFCSYFY